MRDIGLRLIGVLIVIGGSLGVAIVVSALIRRGGRRVPVVAHLTARTRLAFRTLVAAGGAAIGLASFAPPGRWSPLRHVVVLLIIAAAAWLLASLLVVLEDSALPRLRIDVKDNRRARAVRTQLIVLRRVTVVVVAILALGAGLMTFQDVRVVGTSLLASAGVVAAIAAFATNALLGNVVAGLQMAFSGALRLDDVVVVEGEWGRVEEITLTYVVVHIWDDRRLVLPSSYFTTKPFESWTHTASELTGTVLVEVDYGIDMAELRRQVKSFVDGNPLWDGRVCLAQVVDAVGGSINVRVLVSAQDAPTLWDLRCAVREHLVVWLRDTNALPVNRTELTTPS